MYLSREYSVCLVQYMPVSSEGKLLLSVITVNIFVALRKGMDCSLDFHMDQTPFQIPFRMLF